MRFDDLGRVLGDLDAEAWVEHAERHEDLVIVARFLAAVSEGAAGPWKQRAACRGQTALMFPERGEPADLGLALCERGKKVGEVWALCRGSAVGGG